MCTYYKYDIDILSGHACVAVITIHKDISCRCTLLPPLECNTVRVECDNEIHRESSLS